MDCKEDIAAAFKDSMNTVIAVTDYKTIGFLKVFSLMADIPLDVLTL